MQEYKDTVQQMYEQICDFVRNHSDIEEELFAQEKEFLRLSLAECNAGQMFFDWFIFDYKLKKYDQRLFDVFLQSMKKSIAASLYDVYLNIGRDRFSFIKVKAVNIGKQFVCQDIVSLTEYQIDDRTITNNISKGDYLIGRVLPFGKTFILASQCLCFRKQDYDLFGMCLKNKLIDSKVRIDAYKVYKMLYPERIPEKLSIEDKFALLCKEGGLTDDAIEDIFLNTRIAIKNKNGSISDVIAPVIESMNKPEWFNIEEFYEAFVKVWNSFAVQIHHGVEKGPNEKVLIEILTNKMSSMFPPPKNELEKKALTKKVQQWSDQWFVTPLKELEGKTPKQVIMDERKSLGNPQKEFGFHFNIEFVAMDEKKEKEAEKLANDAAEHMANDEYHEALEAYQNYLKLWAENHVVWHNMGVCYAMLLQKRKAEKCFKTAWQIKPDYELAYNKWEELTSMYKEDMVHMVKEMQRNKNKLKNKNRGIH